MFRPTNGCGLNVTLLDTILKEAHSKYHTMSLAFLDLRKAFDTASRIASMAALKLKGVPPILFDYLSWTVSNAPLLVEGERIDTARGVKQRDPCSPIIFNSLIDTCLESLTEGMGWTHNEHRVTALSYADDLILLAKTPVGLQASSGGDWSSPRESPLRFQLLRRFVTQHGQLLPSNSLLTGSACRCWGSNRRTST